MKFSKASKAIAFIALALISSKNNFAQCTTPTFIDNLNSASGWTLVDPANGNGSLAIQAGEMHMYNPECTNGTNGVHNNREVRMHRQINTLSNFMWKAECRIRISDGNGVSHTFMGFTAGTQCPQGVNTTTDAAVWDCNVGSANSLNINQTTTQDGIFASLIAFGYNNNAADTNNQIPNNNGDQDFPPPSVQTSTDTVPVNLGWRIYGHAVDGLNTSFFGTGTPRSSNYTGIIPPNRSRGIALPNTGINYYVRLERLTATNCRISVFSDATMTQHVPGSPQCFTINSTIVNLNTLQNFAHVSGSKFRRIRGEVDDYRIFNGCSDAPNFTITPVNPIGCSNLTNTLTATSGATTYTWSSASGNTITTTNTVQINPSSNTVYTVTASFPGTCPISTTHTLTVNSPVTYSLSVTSTPTICSGTPVIAYGTVNGTPPIERYSWILDECDQNGILNGGYTTGINWVTGTLPSSPYQFPNSQNLPCNKYYKIKLAVQNLAHCQPWQEKSIIIFISCSPTPVISGATNICYGSSTMLCADDDYYFPLSTYTVTWGPKKNNINCLTTPTLATTTIYTLTVTNTVTGCSGSDTHTVNVYDNNPDFSLGGDLGTGNPATYTCHATPASQTATLNPDFGYAWRVEEIDIATGSAVPTSTVYNPYCWWNYGLGTNEFSGYNGTNTVNCTTSTVGQFLTNHKYRITRGTWITNVCQWQQVSKTIMLCTSCRTSDGKPMFIVENDYTAPDFSYLMNGQKGIASDNVKALRVYPNPSTGLLNINVKNANDKSYKIEVFDVFGKLVYSNEQVNNQGSEFNTEINLSNLNLSEGLYLINVSSDNQTLSQRVIIQK